MTDLSPDARRLVDAAREERLPVEVQARIFEGLKARIALPPAPVPTLGIKAPVGLLVGALLVAGLVASRALAPAPAPAPARSVVSRADAVPVVPEMAETQGISTTLPSPPRAPVVRGPGPATGVRAARVARPREDAPGVLEEALLLRRARAASGGRSLTLLDGYDRGFPRGTLQAEAWLLRVRVLCAEGREAEARRWASRVRQAHPGTPAATAVGATCGVRP